MPCSSHLPSITRRLGIGCRSKKRHWCICTGKWRSLYDSSIIYLSVKELKSAKKSLKGILETHFHADFVSGHLELREKTGACIYFGPTAGARCKFEQHELKDGEVCSSCMSYCRGVWSRDCIIVLNWRALTLEELLDNAFHLHYSAL